MKGLMALIVALCASVGFAYEYTDSAGVLYNYEKVSDGSGLRLTLATVANDTLFKGCVEIPDNLSADGRDLPLTIIGEGAISGKTIKEVYIPQTVKAFEVYAFDKNAITNVVFGCDKPALTSGWTGVLDPDMCVFSVQPWAKGWGAFPGELADPQGDPSSGEIVYTPVFKLISLALNPDYVVAISPESGEIADGDPIEVSITQTAIVEEDGVKVKIFYTTDGSEPNEDSRLYRAPFLVKETSVVKAYLAVYYINKEGGYDLGGIGPTASCRYQFPRPNGGPYTDEVDGVTWTYLVKGGKAMIERVSFEQPAVPVETAGELTLPAELGLRPVAGVGVSAFERCRYLTKVVFPETVTTIASFAFKDCLRLKDVVYSGEKPAIDLAAFDGCPLAVVPGPIVTVKVAVPIEIQADPDDGTLDIPENWLDLMAERFGGETWKTQFTDRFGDGSTNTLKVATGKVDRSGHALQVWQEYVAGTDPLDTDSVLTAFVEMTAEGPVITWSPDLSDEGRVYTIYGMKNLTDRQKPTDVTALTPAERQAAGYRFFFVAVRLAPAAGGAE